jgi:hypothetical protein
VFSFFDKRGTMEAVHEKLLQLIESEDIPIKPEEILILHGKNTKKIIDDFDGKEKTHITQKKLIYEQGD